MVGNQNINFVIGAVLIIYGADVLFQNGMVSLKNARIIVIVIMGAIFILKRQSFEKFEAVSWVGQNADENSGPGIGMGLSSYAKAPLMVGDGNDDVVVENGIPTNNSPDLGKSERIFIPRGGSIPNSPGVREGNNDTQVTDNNNNNKWLTTGAKVVANEPNGTEQEFNATLSSVMGV